MSTINVSNLNDGTTTVATTFVTNGSAKSWINADGTGTISIRDSLNVSSIVDTFTGQITSNFSNAFANVGYSATAATNQFHNYVTNGGKSVNSNLVAAANGSNSNVDSAQMNCTCQGELA